MGDKVNWMVFAAQLSGRGVPMPIGTPRTRSHTGIEAKLWEYPIEAMLKKYQPLAEHPKKSILNDIDKIATDLGGYASWKYADGDNLPYWKDGDTFGIVLQKLRWAVENT